MVVPEPSERAMNHSPMPKGVEHSPNVRIERGCGMRDGRPVYALIAYDASKKCPLWKATQLIALPCYPKQPTRWIDGKPNKRERAKVMAALAKLEGEVPNAK